MLATAAIEEQTLVISVAGVAILAILLRRALLSGMVHLLRAALIVVAIALCVSIALACWREWDGGPPVKETLASGYAVVTDALVEVWDSVRTVLGKG